MGLEGRYVQARLVQPLGVGEHSSPAGRSEPKDSSPTLTFALAEGLGLEPCLAELVQRVLPIW
jgi:hypothetical protein